MSIGNPEVVTGGNESIINYPLDALYVLERATRHHLVYNSPEEFLACATVGIPSLGNDPTMRTLVRHAVDLKTLHTAYSGLELVYEKFTCVGVYSGLPVVISAQGFGVPHEQEHFDMLVPPLTFREENTLVTNSVVVTERGRDYEIDVRVLNPSFIGDFDYETVELHLLECAALLESHQIEQIETLARYIEFKNTTNPPYELLYMLVDNPNSLERVTDSPNGICHIRAYPGLYKIYECSLTDGSSGTYALLTDPVSSAIYLVEFIGTEKIPSLKKIFEEAKSILGSQTSTLHTGLTHVGELGRIRMQALSEDGKINPNVLRDALKFIHGPKNITSKS